MANRLWVFLGVIPTLAQGNVLINDSYPPCEGHFGGKKKVQVAHTRLPSVGFRSWSRFLAVSHR